MENTGKHSGLFEQFQSVQLNDRQLCTIKGGDDSNVPDPSGAQVVLPAPQGPPPK